MSDEFIQSLRSSAASLGSAPLKLDEPWKGRGDRYFLVEKTLVFDLKRWKFVAWTRAPGTPVKTWDVMPEWMWWVLVARGWEELVYHATAEPESARFSTAEARADAKIATLFPLCNSDRDVAAKGVDWAYLQERSCWINRERERCSCSACYPEPLRDEGDYSSVQLHEAHCVHCRCGRCVCALSAEAEAGGEAELAIRCGACTICVVSERACE
jgi:hypothetical protein